MHHQKIDQLRAQLNATGAAGAVLTGIDNVYYLSGYQSVMDGWQLPEPMSAVYVPADKSAPVVLCLPEASLIGIIVAKREGAPISYDKLAVFDLLNFCQTARAEDAYMQLGADITAELGAIAGDILGTCQPTVIQSIATFLQDLQVSGKILFDDMRVALRVQEASGSSIDIDINIGFDIGDAFETMFAARSIKTPSEIALFKESGRKADSVMAHTVSQLGVGTKWCDVEKSVAHYMIDEGIDPLPSSPMLFGGGYDLAFRPDLFRTHYDTPFEAGQIAILETQGRYKNIWLDINRTAHMGEAAPEYREQHDLVKRCFLQVAERLVPGNNSSEICEDVRHGLAQDLDAPGKLLMIVHSIGHVPLESPTAFPSTGLHAAVEGFEIKENMVLSFDCLYFGSRLGPSHMENVFTINEKASSSIYHYPLDLIEV